MLQVPETESALRVAASSDGAADSEVGRVKTSGFARSELAELVLVPAHRPEQSSNNEQRITVSVGGLKPATRYRVQVGVNAGE